MADRPVVEATPSHLIVHVSDTQDTIDFYESLFGADGARRSDVRVIVEKVFAGHPKGTERSL